MDKISKGIVFIGPIPPPIGGVSIHIQRLSSLLTRNFKIDFIDESYLSKDEYFNIRSFNFFVYLKKVLNSDLLYIHSGKRGLKFFHLFVGRIFQKKIILTIHSYRSSNIIFLKFLDELFCRLANIIVVVNPEIHELISLPVTKSYVIQPFIPPKMENEPMLPIIVNSWIKERKKNGKVIICANAWQLATYMGQDLYGLDLCIEVVGMLINKKIPVSFVFNVASIEKYKEIFLSYKLIIEKSTFAEDFLLVNENLSFVKLIEKSDIVIRPTNTDGDALTIREALFLGKPIIASDVVSRPKGTILFKTRNIADLESKIIDCINNEETGSLNFEYKKEIEEYRRTYLEIIEKVLD